MAVPKLEKAMSEEQTNNWYAEQETEQEVHHFKEMDLITAPSDYNVITIMDQIERGFFKIPSFQRNYVWDLTRASRFIESLLINIPIPQIFIYRETKKDHLVIDGQQRLMTLFYFVKGRFPKKEKRTRLREIYDNEGGLSEAILNDDEYFMDFKLKLPAPEGEQENPFVGRTFDTLYNDQREDFEQRTIRAIIIREVNPMPEQGAIFEIFNRLNAGGVTLRTQEIRTSLYHSDFYKGLHRLNLHPSWRKLHKGEAPDLHMRDVEILLRAFAMLEDGDAYKPSVKQFLNRFSGKAKGFSEEKNEYLFKLMKTFLENINEEAITSFENQRGGFHVFVFEAAFVAYCSSAFAGSTLDVPSIQNDFLLQLKEDADFRSASLNSTASEKNTKLRIEAAHRIFNALNSPSEQWEP